MPQEITSLKIQVKNKERVSIFLDDEYAFSISLSAATHLKRGQQLSPEDIATLKEEDEQNRAYQQSLKFIGMRPRSRVEIERYLQKKFYSDAVVSSTTERLLANQYLDDETFARFWLENRERFRPRSARAIRYELRQKGIELEVIDNVLAELDEEASAWAAVEPKLDRWQNLDEAEFKQKLIGFLNRRGFNYTIARSVYERAWNLTEDTLE